MKILAFSDLHRDTTVAQNIVDASKGADVIVGAGDFATYGRGAGEVFSVLKSSGVPTVIVSGNHDNSRELQRLCEGWENGHLLHGQKTIIGNLTFFGLGDEIPKRHDAEWNQCLSEDQAATMLSRCPQNAVLVTHTPPFGHCDLQKDGTHEGSISILAAIKAKKPILNLCGHIHSSWGTSEMIGDTAVNNLGPSINWFKI